MPQLGGGGAPATRGRAGARSAASSRSPAAAAAGAARSRRARRADRDDADPAVATPGQVGSQIKMRVGSALADRQRPHAEARTTRPATAVVAEIDFLGEGDEERLTGKLYNFRRGVTRYPIAGRARSFRSPTADLKQIYAADDRAAYRDRHRLSDQGHPRRALCRRDARQAFRAARLDRHRQVDHAPR